jgi:hypothetical protein
MCTSEKTKLEKLCRFADEMTNSHIYKFSQNNLYSYNIIANCLRKIHISENRETITVRFSVKKNTFHNIVEFVTNRSAITF